MSSNEVLGGKQQTVAKRIDNSSEAKALPQSFFRLQLMSACQLNENKNEVMTTSIASHTTPDHPPSPPIGFLDARATTTLTTKYIIPKRKNALH